ncbi:MAG: Fic family protein [Melioribacteraceae bacterium]|nr:Fic family protein [Melioribacteraceae bacterium]
MRKPIFNPQKPYNSLPLLFPDEKHWKTITIYEQVNKANKALAELKGRLSAIPNPQILINTLSLQEAKDSSSIENIFTTNDKLFKAFTSSSTTDKQTTEVLRYGKSLVDAFKVIKSGTKFSIELIENIYRNIKDETDGIRDFEVYIGNSFETIYTPPCCKDVLVDKLNNWLEYANNKDEIEPLIKLAVLHYQFETIHPFKDGNGRTGRVLNVLLLSSFNLLDEPILYLSKYINEFRREYYMLLQGVTENNEWHNWLIYMLKAVENTAIYTLNKVLGIIDIIEKTKDKIKNDLPEIYSFELIEILFNQVYSKYSFLEENKIASRNTVAKYFTKLVDAKILEKEKIGKELIFKNIALYELIKG